MEEVRGQCLICECPRGGGEAADNKAVSLEKQLEGLFLLEVPHSLLSRFLEGGDAEVNICGDCRPLVEECKVKYEQLCQVTRQWEEIRANAVSKMKEDPVKKGEEPQGKGSPLKKMKKETKRFLVSPPPVGMKGNPFPVKKEEPQGDVRKEIKRFVAASSPTGKKVNPFLEGDHKAKELTSISPPKKARPATQRKLCRPGRKSKSTRTCPTCCALFPDRYRLKVHQRFHTGERPFPCDQCGKAFHTKGTLKQHLYIHTGEKPHECPVCQKRFRKQGNLGQHLRVHSGEKPFRCQVCGKAYADKSNFNKHRKTCNQ